MTRAAHSAPACPLDATSFVRRRTTKLAGLPTNPLVLQPLPRWTRSERDEALTEGEAAFAAGAALLALDRIVRAEPPWLGALRMRQALLAAAGSARLLRLREDEAALRDAHHLTRLGDDPGPAGRLHRSWRDLAAGRMSREPAAVDRLCQERGLPPLSGLLPSPSGGPGGHSPIAAAAAIAADVVAQVVPAQGVDGEVLALMLADIALAARLGWSAPIPLLAAAILDPSLKRGPERRRPRPRDPDWPIACHAAYARAAADAHARALDLARRADRLLTLAPKVRSKGGTTALGTLLAEEAVAAATLTGLGSDRAARRFLERLVTLGAIRELTGRSSFRLYGL